ncbi:penicillin acylase family protein [Roseococcus sp. DSY-14]|uniref:penicillin acylase family protein n=1 Tax=Roseococcus sp. DSY-14 TaxID=3369650 RepID=UPI00387AD64A
MARRPHRRRRWRWGRALLGVLALLLALPALLAWLTLPGAVARLEGHGLSAPVALAFDERAIPTVTAASEADAAFALGWLHARERMFQMETMRRGAEGRLAETLGASALRLDRMSRTLGLRPRAEADLAALDGETQALLRRYADGVNARLAERGRFVAPEFLLLGAPERWEPVHSLLWAKVMGLWLSGNWQVELERAALAPRLPEDRLWDLWPGGDDGSGRADVARLSRPGLAEAARRALAAVPVFPRDAPLPDSASNAWAVARGAGGAPMLASDPHLGYGAPTPWYLARLVLPDDSRAGATAPGVPFLVIGRNRDLAWGFTTTHSDTQDVFAGAPVLREREETIRSRGGATETLRVRETAHGPVVGEGLSVRMANLEPGDTAAAGLLRLNRARSVAEARAAAALITSPPQNLVVADRAGGIALFLTGRTPLRAEGHDGALPWAGEGWRGFVPFEEMPHVVAPASGVVANANNRVQPEGHPVFLGRDWRGDWRFRRIHALLAEGPHDLARMAAIQRDAVSLPAREALPFLNALPRGDGAVGRAQALLAEWDGTMAQGLPQPLVWTEWTRRFRAALLRGQGVPDAPAGMEFLRHALADPAARAFWCAGDCRAPAALALGEAVAALQARFGPDPAAWRWGDAHLARFEHPVLRFLPGLGRLARLEAPVDGDNDTVRREGMRGEGYIAVHGAGLRFAADLSAEGAVRMEVATGQSGHPLSRHWGDMLGAWAR